MLKTSEKLARKLAALKHGIHANGCLPYEDRDVFEANKKRWHAHFKPFNDVLKVAVDAIAMLYWQLIRNENAVVSYALCEPLGIAIAQKDHSDFAETANELIEKRDEDFARASRALETIAKSIKINVNSTTAKKLAKMLHSIGDDIKQIKNQHIMANDYFFGISEKNVKHAKYGIELAVHLQRQIGLYRHLEEQERANLKLHPQLEHAVAILEHTEIHKSSNSETHENGTTE